MNRHRHRKPRPSQAPESPSDINERIARLQRLIEAQTDTGSYSRRLLWTGLRFDDRDEYGERYIHNPAGGNGSTAGGATVGMMPRCRPVLTLSEE